MRLPCRRGLLVRLCRRNTAKGSNRPRYLRLIQARWARLSSMLGQAKTPRRRALGPPWAAERSTEETMAGNGPSWSSFQGGVVVLASAVAVVALLRRLGRWQAAAELRPSTAEGTRRGGDRGELRTMSSRGQPWAVSRGSTRNHRVTARPRMSRRVCCHMRDASFFHTISGSTPA